MKHLLPLILTGLLVTACAKDNDDKAKGENPPASEKSTHPYYSTTDLASLSSKTSGELGIPVFLADVKDYGNEHNYRRILLSLSNNQDTIKKNAALVEKIVVGENSSIILENKGKYIISLDFLVNETEIVELFSLSLPIQHRRLQVEGKLNSVVPKQIRVQDLVGLSLGNIDAVAAKLSQVSQTVDFTNDISFKMVILSNYFAIVPSGMIIDTNASAETINYEIIRAINARRMWAIEAKPLIDSLGLAISYQPGTFNGPEMLDVIKFIKSNANTIKSITAPIASFIIGKKSDYDLQKSRLLVDYRASQEELTNLILKAVPPKVNLNFDTAKTNLLKSFENLGVHLEKIEIDFMASPETLAVVKQFNETVVPYIDVVQLNALGIKSLRLSLIDQTTLIGSSILSVQLPTTAQTINALLKSTRIAWNHDTLIRELNVHAELVNVSVKWTSEVVVSESVNMGLDIFKNWFTAKDATYFASHKIQSIEVFFNSSTVTSFKSGALTINLVDFSSDKIEKILK